MLTEKRTEIKAALEAGIVDGEPIEKPVGFRAFEYVGESLVPPCAAVVPAEPYIRPPSQVDGIPWGQVRLGIDVLLLSARLDEKTAAQLIDQVIEYAYRVLNEGFDVRGVSRPGVVTISGSKYIGSVLTIEQTTKEP